MAGCAQFKRGYAALSAARYPRLRTLFLSESMKNKTVSRMTMLHQHGAALIIVLAFVVLLSGLVVAYFSRATTDRQVSSASYNNTAADLLARSGLDIVVDDFKQEIANGSTTATVGGVTIYKPSSNANMRPRPCGTPSSGTPIPNLIRISS